MGGELTEKILDWMQRLGININTENSTKELHNVQLDETEKLIQLKNEFKVQLKYSIL